MIGINALLEIIRQVFINVFTLNVPGFDFTYWELTVTAVLIAFGISLLRWLFGLPAAEAATSIRSDVHRAMK